MNRAVLHIPADHPSGPGHFPGNPIVPGALLLAETLRAIGAAAHMHVESCTVKSAKFFHPVRPGDTVHIEFSVAPPQEVRFQCAVGEVKVLAGAIDATVGA